jgi:hypothetical protein
MKHLIYIFTICVLAFSIIGNVNAQVPNKISYQGLLTTSSGTPVQDGSYDLQFDIYNLPSGGDLRYTETQNDVSVQRGTFSVILRPSYAIFAESLFVEVTVLDGPGISSPITFSPRSEFTSAPYAFRADTAKYAISSGVAGGGIASVDGVSNPGGDIDLIQQNSITITPNDPANTITIGETHSARQDNPHNTTTAQVGAVGRINNVPPNPASNLTLTPGNAVTIVQSGANALTIGENHSNNFGNPHNTTAAQTGALISVDGVSNAGGDVDFIAGTGMTITPNDGANTVTFAASLGRYAQVWTVALSGGNFTTITQALDSCVNPSPSNPYLVRVMAGVYNESVIMKKYVTLQGAGKYSCYINGTVTGADSCIIDGFYINGGIICNAVSPTITHNFIKNAMGDGIFNTNGAKPWIKQNEIIGCSGWGIISDGWETCPWIIANKIKNNSSGGIRCNMSSPTISNNQIMQNMNYGIYLTGVMGSPSEPTIDDNVIGQNDPDGSGIGIYMEGYAEPRIIANDIYVNKIGIQILPYTQPSILSNDINYNRAFGIRCFSNGASKRVTLHGNHIHSSHPSAIIGIDIQLSNPVITANNVTNNGTDINYVGGPFPTLNQNTFDTRTPPAGGATGQFNATTAGAVRVP